MSDIEVFAYIIILIMFFVSMAIDKYFFGAMVVLFGIAIGIQNQIITIICAAISIFWVGSMLIKK